MISFYNLTFGELINGAKVSYKDPYNIASSLCNEMKNAVLHNPSGYSEDEVCQILALDEDIVVGCTNPFSGRVKIDGNIIEVQQGSYLYSHEDYRKDNVGGDLFVKISNLHPTKNSYFSGISHMAIGLYRAMKYTVFEYPRMIYLRKCRSVVHALLKTESCLLNPIIWIGDFVLLLHRSLLSVLTYSKFEKYVIVESKEVPQTVIDIINFDTHPFAEVHDKEWIEWNLKYKFTDEPRIKRLFLIKNNSKIEAFFITKERFYEKASSRGFKNVNLGALVEWGISPDSILTEKDLYLMSLSCFSKSTDGIQFATTDYGLAKTLRKYFFVGIGEANVGFKFPSVKDPRLKDINNWRLRLAASDTLLN